MRLDRRALVVAKEKVVGAGLEGTDARGRFADGRECAHLEVIGDDDAVESHRRAEEIGEDRLRERYWKVRRRIQCRDHDVRAHDRWNARRDRGPEWRELDAFDR